MDKKQLYERMPETPGVYLMKNAAGAVIYVGKAGNVKRRVSSYFMRPHERRIEALVREIATVDVQQTETAIEALILEAKLIKELEPKYNIREKDGKSFLYIEFTREDFPRVLMVRGKSLGRARGALRRGKRYFGPFTSPSSLREALRIVRPIFPWSDHSAPERSEPAARSKKQARHPAGSAPLKPCFNYQIGLCPGTCIGAISQTEYGKNIKNLKRFFSGEKKMVIKGLERDMAACAKMQEYEKAAEIRKKIFTLRHIQDVALITENRAETAAESRIEGYDISNISGASAVGAMVVFVSGEPAKAEYRAFNIKTLAAPNDVGMLREVLTRRCKNNWPLPDVMVIDGGKPQVNAVRAVLREFGVRVPAVGLAKGADRKGNTVVGAVPPGIELATLIRVRDEAHRFARARHIRRRSKNFLA